MELFKQKLAVNDRSYIEQRKTSFTSTEENGTEKDILKMKHNVNLFFTFDEILSQATYFKKTYSSSFYSMKTNVF